MDHNLNLKQVLKTAIRSTPWSVVVLFLFTCFVAYLSPKAINPDIRYLQSLMINIGAYFTVFCIPIYYLAVKPFVVHFRITHVFRLIVNIVCIFNFGYTILGLLGDQIFALFAEKPNLQLPYAFVLFIFFYAISRLFNAIVYAQNTVSSRSTTPQAIVPNLNKFTKYDLDRVAAHETGHLMLSFLVGKLPNKFTAQIFINGSDNGAAGMVTSINSPNFVADPEFDCWRMHVLLAGQIAEMYIHDLKTNGSGSDYEKWQLLAKQHLENQHEGIYFINPTHDLEFQHNKDKIDALRASQTAVINNFFKLNHPTLIKMYETLKEKKILERNEIIELFQCMQHLDELPYPNGKFTTFLNN